MRLGDLLTQAAARHGDNTALIDQDGASLTWRQLDRRSNSFAGALRHRGGCAGDRVLLACRNTVPAVVALFGTLRADMVAVPLDLDAPHSRLRFVAEDCKPIAAFSTVPNCGLLRDLGLPQLDPDPPQDGICPLPDAGASAEDLALLIYTSGSTSRPKAVMAPHGAVLFAVRAINSVVGNTCEDIILDALPFAFDYGLYQIFLAAQAGARLVLVPTQTSPLALPELMARNRITGLPVTPTLLSLLVRTRLLERVALPDLRYVTSTGDVLQPALTQTVRRALPQVAVFPMYGLTECKRVSILPPEHLEGREGSVGRPLPGTSVQVVDSAGQSMPPGAVGELIVRGPHVMAGYWNNPEATARTFGVEADGLRILRTGDRFHMDAEGFLYFHGRSQDFVKSGGLRLGLREIEATLAALPGVTEVAVVGVTHKLLGTEVIACMVCAGDGAVVTAACRAAMPPPYGPRRYELRTALPRTPNGKFDRLRLQAELQDAVAANA